MYDFKMCYQRGIQHGTQLFFYIYIYTIYTIPPKGFPTCCFLTVMLYPKGPRGAYLGSELGSMLVCFCGRGARPLQILWCVFDFYVNKFVFSFCFGFIAIVSK